MGIYMGACIGRKSCKARRAQTAMEYFLIMGMVMAVLIPTWAYVTAVQRDAGDQISLSYAHNAVNKIAGIADMVHSQGSPASMKTMIHIPAGVEEIQLRNREVNFRVRTSSGTSDVYAITIANLTGSIPTTPGDYHITINANYGCVQVQVS